MKNNGTHFNGYMTNYSLFPLYYFLCFGSKAEAETFFNYTIRHISYFGRIKFFYSTLDINTLNLMHNEFMGASEVKLAYKFGLEITE